MTRLRSTLRRTRRLLSLAAAGTLSLHCLPGLAQSEAADYPARNVSIVVGFPPGTATDTVARILAERLAARFKKPFVIDNKPGQGGSLGAAAVAKAPADGLTLLMSATAPLSINPHLYAKLTYDPQKDFAPIGLTSWLSYILVARPEFGVSTLPELVARAKANPGQISFASIGNGTTSHLLMTLLAQRTDTRFNHIPYKGSAQSQTDVMGGQVDLTFDTLVSLMPHVKTGRLKALAVSSLNRSAFAPTVPTVAEQGVPGFDAGAWLGLLAPAGTPRPIVDRLNRELNQILDEPETRRKLTEAGTEILKSTPDEFTAHIRSENVKWGRLVRETGAKID
ncbi:MAG TPA: tripartite tricarboxylate transporter substrate binding protein [Burkholderiaceae bacterium]|jgi:tripartite-type tricarboxylate transporter receptor subunit TctC|nr:tripartite tricarboxylate transporter substrate binding protein [Burkholderiaceae bacterium]